MAASKTNIEKGRTRPAPRCMPSGARHREAVKPRVTCHPGQVSGSERRAGTQHKERRRGKPEEKHATKSADAGRKEDARELLTGRDSC